MSSVMHKLKLCLILLATSLLPGCAANAEDELHTSFIWGPSEYNIDKPLPSFRNEPPPGSKAAELRDNDDFGTGFRSDAPNEKDWREVRGTDKGPTIFGATLKFDLSEGGSALKVGAVRRGAKRTYGPQFIFEFK